jgi:hypothetical protein
MQQQQGQGEPPLELIEILTLAASSGVAFDRGIQAQLAEHLPSSPSSADSVVETIQSPQLQQAAAGFTQALNGLGGQGLLAEMRLNPAGYGVEQFLRALQEATEKAEGEGGVSGSEEPVDTNLGSYARWWD